MCIRNVWQKESLKDIEDFGIAGEKYTTKYVHNVVMGKEEAMQDMKNRKSVDNGDK